MCGKKTMVGAGKVQGIKIVNSCWPALSPPRFTPKKGRVPCCRELWQFFNKIVNSFWPALSPPRFTRKKRDACRDAVSFGSFSKKPSYFEGINPRYTSPNAVMEILYKNPHTFLKSTHNPTTICCYVVGGFCRKTMKVCFEHGDLMFIVSQCQS